MGNPIISIIIPIYNTCKVLRHCIDSCLKQSFRDIEVILVNDASSDNSLSICEGYAKKDKRVVLINKTKNEGVDVARFLGMKQARGKYLMFVDSDDNLTNSEVLSIMHEKAESTKVDYVEIASQYVIDKRGWIKRPCISPMLGLIKQPELFDKYFISFFGVQLLTVCMWGKLYRKAVIDNANVKITGLKMGEDVAFNMQLFPHLKSIYILDTIGYNYRRGGVTSKYNPNTLSIWKSLYHLREEFIEKYKYYKALDFIHLEQRHILREAIYQAIIFGNGTREEIIERTRIELQDSIYERILQAYDHPTFYNSPFVKAIENKDAKKMYSLCLERAQKTRLERTLKRYASRILQII